MTLALVPCYNDSTAFLHIFLLITIDSIYYSSSVLFCFIFCLLNFPSFHFLHTYSSTFLLMFLWPTTCDSLVSKCNIEEREHSTSGNLVYQSHGIYQIMGVDNVSHNFKNRHLWNFHSFILVTLPSFKNEIHLTKGLKLDLFDPNFSREIGVLQCVIILNF